MTRVEGERRVVKEMNNCEVIKLLIKNRMSAHALRWSNEGSEERLLLLFILLIKVIVILILNVEIARYDWFDR